MTISASLSVLDLPWIIKPLWGAISDFVPLFGYRRRPYLVLANMAACVAFAWVAMIDTTTALIPALVLTATAMAISSTLSGALLVETGQKTNNSANYVNQQWLCNNIAQMIAVVMAGYLIEFLSPIGAHAYRGRDCRDRSAECRPWCFADQANRARRSIWRRFGSISAPWCEHSAAAACGSSRGFCSCIISAPGSALPCILR